MRALLLGLTLALCSCVPGANAVAHATPPPATAKAVVLQAQDVTVMQKCPQSDSWAGLMLRGQPEMLPTGMAGWSQLQAAGATEGWLSLYADNLPECPLLLGNAPPKGRLVYSVAIKFKDSLRAAADYASDSQNFPVAPSFFDRFMAAGGKLTKGTDTGLGDHSVVATITLRDAPTFVVFWQKKNFEAVIYAINISGAEGSSAATHMDGRIH
ncbi:MAG: hypothetical protein M3R21_08600 [Candidatus Dormibacteraeota bacterium]|nr:hypothetical protein [Candidatus Dormibacteraeota bacterium]